ncbi:PTS sugar transporter subunit IIA [Nitratireductor aquimarinus]|uniref:PTS sugar transporter subunit IIA n=1 Tax=Alphaproteobacteria TaxID=28211 RepID=UPI0019D40903|nr:MULTISPECIES: PTS sugar transporter subunit IIA [Alphaproteobacteria]MBN7759336.1 PTS sugar transporter subunit IIA [Nitratireductor aquimarinus]MBY6002153.1 PTS sugar transporter subunit IIA [Tritonibacter mobilis]MBY6024586.1 PTS sugar transporter subunit IIA [Nitratireductor sp. DP7N14-4]
MIPVRVSFAVDFSTDRTSNTRKAALWSLAARVAELRPKASKLDIAGALYARERLGTTAMGGGVALPHTVLTDEDASMIVVRRLERPVEFDAPDGMAVDTLVALMGGKHDIKWLRAALLRLGRLGQQGPLRHQLRTAATQDEVAAVLAALGLDVHTDQKFCVNARTVQAEGRAALGMTGRMQHSIALR